MERRSSQQLTFYILQIFLFHTEKMKGSGNLTVDKMEGNFNKEDTQVSIGKKDNINDHDLNSISQRKQTGWGKSGK